MELEVTLNKVAIGSLREFCLLENRYHNGSKPTSFVLQCGVDNQESFVRELLAADEALADLDRSSKNWYYRTGLLEAFMNQETHRRLQKASEEVLSGKNAPQMFENAIWERAYQGAVTKVAGEYSLQEKDRNRVQNFLMLLLYRAEYYFPKLFKNTRILSKFPKFVYTGVCGTREYYFLRLLSLCGCDVYGIHPSPNIEIKAENWREKVQCIQKPSEVQGKIPAYDIEQIRLKVQQRKAKSAVPAANKVQPVEKGRTVKNIHMQDKPTSGNTGINLTRPERKGQEQEKPREKSYEELASMAGSVVMVVVFNEKREIFASGSGVIINNDGYILTNFHVIQGAVAYGVRLEEEEELHITTELIKYHPENDLALIRIDPIARPAIPVYQGNKLVRGQKVVAIGSPLGLMNTVSDGIIAGFRQIDEVSMIQFTAPISPGSSGGALLSLQGELIGIVSASFSEGENLNLAVDYNVVRSFVQGFI